MLKGIQSLNSPPQDNLANVPTTNGMLSCLDIAKLEDGDFKGAVRLAASEDTIAELHEEVLAPLYDKHPSPHPNSCIPTLAHILNLSEDNCAWTQASLPVGFGGLGIRSLALLEPSAFLASAAGCSDIIRLITPLGSQMPCTMPPRRP